MATTEVAEDEAEAAEGGEVAENVRDFVGTLQSFIDGETAQAGDAPSDDDSDSSCDSDPAEDEDLVDEKKVEPRPLTTAPANECPAELPPPRELFNFREDLEARSANRKKRAPPPIRR